MVLRMFYAIIMQEPRNDSYDPLPLKNNEFA